MSSTSLLDDAFAHNAWASLRLIDALASLAPAELAATVHGTTRSLLETVRHIVESETFDLAVLQGEESPIVRAEDWGLEDMRSVVERNAEGWSTLLSDGVDPGVVVREVDPGDGYLRDAPVGIRLAAALEHGTDHRSQICTTLATLGLAPPLLSVMDWALERGRIHEVYPAGYAGGTPPAL